MIIEKADRLKEVTEYYFSKKLEEIRLMRIAGKDVINLGIGSPDLAPSPETVEAAVQSLKSPRAHGYTTSRGLPELRQKITEWYFRTYSVILDPQSEILPLLGSKEGITFISLAFLNPGDEVLVPNPGYPAYSAAAKLAGAIPKHYDLREENNWEPDFKELEKQDLSKIKVMWINYPSMPAGAPGSQELFSRLVGFTKSRQILLCNDNPYSLILNPKPLSLLSAPKSFENCLELNSMSKSFNMAGWRVGLLAGKSDLVNAVIQVKSNVDSGMFLPIQMGAMTALDNSQKWHETRNATYLSRRGIAEKIFDAIGFKYQRDQVGMFLWGKASENVSNVENFLDEILKKQNVFITPGFIFGTNGERFARLSLCSPVEALQKVLERVKAHQ